MRPVLLLVLGACFTSESPRPEAPASKPDAASECTTAVSAVIQTAITVEPDRNDWDAETRSNLRAVLVNRCVEDRWTAEARTCLVRAKSKKDFEACWEHGLTDDQRHKADHVGEAVVEAGRKAKKHRGDAGGTALQVTGLEPPNGDAAGGTYVLIRGHRFIEDGPRNAKVYFGSRQGNVIRFASDSELIVEAPGGNAGDTVDVLVIFEPGGELKLPKAFTFMTKP